MCEQVAHTRESPNRPLDVSATERCLLGSSQSTTLVDFGCDCERHLPPNKACRRSVDLSPQIVGVSINQPLVAPQTARSTNSHLSLRNPATRDYIRAHRPVE
ncbi:hypothetical protein MTO96_016177 [Rhipicephalus appendiculatus]